MAVSVAAYLEFLVTAVEDGGGQFLREPAVEILSNDDLGILEGTAEFADGSKLDLYLFTDTLGDFPVWVIYSYHYRAPDDTCVFRYDNSPHHRGKRFFPHHKHFGPQEIVNECRPAHIRGIISEIRTHLV